MSRIRNAFQSTKRAPPPKPVLDISSNIQFPSLSTEVKADDPIWNCEKVRIFRDDAKYYKNGNIYEGEFDEGGLPCYGKLTFANGDVYEGPIREQWIKDDEEENSEDETYSEETDENYEDWDEYYEEKQQTETYGRLTRCDGSVFWGVFCFGDRKKW